MHRLCHHYLECSKGASKLAGRMATVECTSTVRRVEEKFALRSNHAPSYSSTRINREYHGINSINSTTAVYGLATDVVPRGVIGLRISARADVVVLLVVRPGFFRVVGHHYWGRCTRDSPCT